MSTEILIVPKRETFGKAAVRDLKKSGMIPAVVYGLNEPPVAIAISPKVVARVLASDTGMNSVMFLQREGTDIKRLCPTSNFAIVCYTCRQEMFDDGTKHRAGCCLSGLSSCAMPAPEVVLRRRH